MVTWIYHYHSWTDFNHWYSSDISHEAENWNMSLRDGLLQKVSRTHVNTAKATFSRWMQLKMSVAQKIFTRNVLHNSPRFPRLDFHTSKRTKYMCNKIKIHYKTLFLMIYVIFKWLEQYSLATARYVIFCLYRETSVFSCHITKNICIRIHVIN